MNQDDPNLLYRDQIIAAKRELRARMPDLKERFEALTRNIEAQIEAIARERARGTAPIPEVRFAELPSLDAATVARIKQRGIVVVRGVFEKARIDKWNAELASYISDNHYLEKQAEKRGLDKYFSTLSSSRPQIYGLYWSKPQMEARQSEELAQTRRWLNRLWDINQDGKPVFNPDQECTYADRVRQREPGDASLGLSPHIDGGSIERWIDPGYRQVYDHVFGGDLAAYDPFSAAYRTETKEIPSPAVCNMFRTFQAWTALTAQGPGDGTVNVVPIANAMAAASRFAGRYRRRRSVWCPCRACDGDFRAIPCAAVARFLPDSTRRCRGYRVVASRPDSRC